MNIKPLDNWLIIKPRPKEESVGKIALPVHLEAPPSFLPILGDVIAAGEGRRTESGDILPMRVKKGDVVVLNYLTVRPMSLDAATEVVMCREHEVGFLMETEASKLTLVKN